MKVLLIILGCVAYYLFGLIIMTGIFHAEEPHILIDSDIPAILIWAFMWPVAIGIIIISYVGMRIIEGIWKELDKFE